MRTLRACHENKTVLNLTDNDITVITGADPVTFKSSGYIARVKYEKREASWVPTPCTKCPKTDNPEDANHGNQGIVICERRPDEIIVDWNAFGTPSRGVLSEQFIICEIYEDYKGCPLDGLVLLVTPKVAEAAYALQHPLWRIMLWAEDTFDDFIPIGAKERIINYRALCRVPQGPGA